MAKSSLLNTRTANLLELLGNGHKYSVPPFQRDYSWEEEQWDDLWSDLIELKDAPEDRHYMGALVVEARSDREFLIIDGQQRLATLSVLALAVIDRLLGMARSGIEPDANRERAAALRSRFIGEKHPASLIESSKLSLNQTDDAFYQDYLVQLREARNPRGLPRSSRLLWEAFQFFRNALESMQSVGGDGKALAELLSETAGRQFSFILITVEDELNAYTVFETLNARGIELSTTDLLKNYLFSRVRVASDLEALQRRWRSLILTVRQERFPEFLRYHLSCEIPRIRSERLFKIVRERVSDASQVFELMEALEQRAELYAALADPNHTLWIERPGSRQYIRDLKLFRVRQMTPLLFAAWERYSEHDFTRVLKLVATLSFRYSIVSGLNPNALEPAYHEAAKAVLGAQAAGLRAVFTILRDIYVDDEKFAQDFARFVIDTHGQRKKLAKYVLARLESDASGRECNPDTDPGTIEHILPENPGQEWAQFFPSSLWDSSVYRLGNLTLLESAANRRVGNAAFADKVAAYGASGYALSTAIRDMAAEEWTPELLEERQRHMANRAVSMWRADLA